MLSPLLFVLCVLLYVAVGIVVGGFLCRFITRNDYGCLTVACLFFWPLVALSFGLITVGYSLWRWSSGVKK